MKKLEEVISSINEKNSNFREKIEKQDKRIKIRFSSSWFYGWYFGGDLFRKRFTNKD